MMDDLWIIKKYIFENIHTKVCCKHQMAKLGGKKKKKKPGGKEKKKKNKKKMLKKTEGKNGGEKKKKKKTWRGCKGSDKYQGLQFVHSFSSTQVLSQAINTEELQQQATCII